MDGSQRLLHLALIAVLIGNTIEAGADLGGLAASINLLFPIQPARQKSHHHGERVNGRPINVLGWITTAAIFPATIGLLS